MFVLIFARCVKMIKKNDKKPSPKVISLMVLEISIGFIPYTILVMWPEQLV